MNLLRKRMARYDLPQQIKAKGVYPYFRCIESEQDTEVMMNGRRVLMFGSNSYLGLTNHPRVIAAAAEATRQYGTGCAGSRFLNGTIDLHLQLEHELAQWVGKEDAMVYSTGFQVNLGVVSCVTGKDDYAICDELDHASIVEGRRLSFSTPRKYRHGDMVSLERELARCRPDAIKLIVTDGVFSMDGNVAPMDKICDLAEKYDALVMVDECHSAGVVGATGHGVSEQFNCYGRIDIHTGTLGKAFGGAIGGFTTGRKEIIDLLRQRSRPYLFSNSIPPSVVGASLEMFRILKESNDLHTKQQENVTYFREKMLAAGFAIKPPQSAICAVMLYDAKLSQEFAAALQERGIFVTGFYYPVVPKGQARIRVQVSAGHTREQLERCVEAFTEVGHALGVLK